MKREASEITNPSVQIDTRIPEQNAGEEYFIGVISGATRRKRILSVETFDIMVTNQRLIFAFVPASGGYALRQKHRNMSVQSILSENSHNFAIGLNHIKSIQLTAGRSYNDCCQKRQEEDGSLEIDAGNKHLFSLPPLNALRAKEVLKNAGLI